MKLIGITGGPGTGKSTITRLLLDSGIGVIDTDEVARAVCEPGLPALAELVEEFGDGILDERGALDRRQLAEIVFRDQAARRRLEGILHPRIRAEWLGRVAAWRTAEAALGWVVIPLLYETAAESEFDQIVCTACSDRTQRLRLGERGWDEAQTGGRIGAQLPLRSKMQRADFVIWTEGEMESTREQLGRIVAMLRQSA